MCMRQERFEDLSDALSFECPARRLDAYPKIFTLCMHLVEVSEHILERIRQSYDVSLRLIFDCLILEFRGKYMDNETYEENNFVDGISLVSRNMSFVLKNLQKLNRTQSEQ